MFATAIGVDLRSAGLSLSIVSHRMQISSGSPYEDVVGYCRAVRIGPMIMVSGTVGDGDDLVDQARNALRRIEIALEQCGATLSDVMRTRMYVTDIARWRELGSIHAEFFGINRPASTMVEVAALIEPHLQIEIEADAYLTDE